MHSTAFGLTFWGFLVAYGVILYAVTPNARTFGAFFRGEDESGREAHRWALTASIFISWIFAKSVTNAANLGASYGIVGGLAYATYWLSIPLAGLVIYRLRRGAGATSLVGFLIGKYGRAAALAFTAAILIRLYNEVWSNTAVVGGYYGPPGSGEFIGAALLFTAVTLFYSMKGGLRGSIVTDMIQAAIFVVFLAAVLLLVLPKHGIVTLMGVGEFKLAAGVDLLLVAALQVLSYPFHDPVLTDRGFITEEKAMLKAFIWAGMGGFLSILAFSLIGIDARLDGLTVGDNAPAAVAKALGIGALFLMTVLMIAAAGSTLDSTFASLSKAVAQELPAVAGRRPPAAALRYGTVAMVAIAVLGNLPMIAGAEILAATTLSGTMVMGLAPVFLLQSWVGYSPWSFHLSFWPGLLLGVLLAVGWIPAAWAIGTGKYALLLGVNCYGLMLCTAGFLLPEAVRRWRGVSPRGEPA
ncbi:MAG TPA: sodium:solute symporter [Candidatus Competibacter sp.]|nr:sodium:solute symporter [Candidatus Competibacteraceae bacterium]HRE55425.1 sodium:solute symporter [Candidatus Competibacter sp.]HUM94242.1 sodium:solute symporter [Candidatus Competibacter sp.]